MSENIPVAKQSPRVKSGTIYWYHGDAFDIDWDVSLTEGEEKTPIQFKPGDKLVWNFFSSTDKTKPIHTFSFEYEDIQDKSVTLKFTPEISKKFAIGSYTYCIKFYQAPADESDHERVVTLNAINKIQVEACH